MNLSSGGSERECCGHWPAFTPPSPSVSRLSPLSLLLWWLGPAALAQVPPDDGPPPTPPEAADPAPEGAEETLPRLPVLLEAPAAPYPAAALAAGRSGAVLLALEVSAQGEVVSADVLAPIGDGFDEAALAAVRNFRFSPALDADGQPTAAQIQYRYVFTLELVPVLAVQGQVREAGTRQPLAGARVRLVDPTGRVLEAVTDAAGDYRFADIAPGLYALSAGAPGLGEEVLRIEVVEGQLTEAMFSLAPTREWERQRSDDEMVVEEERIEPEVVERRLDAREVRAMPGTGGDIVRAVQSLPGVARAPFNAGQVVVRGTSPQDSGFFLGGAPLPIVFHFGGLSTVLNADVLEQVVYLPGNFGVRYGRRLGGVVDLRLDKALPERSWGYLSVDLLQSSLFVEQRASEKLLLSLSARRSYIDVLLQPFVNAAGGAGLRLPGFTDAQGRVLYRADNGSTVDFMGLLSDDRFSYSEVDFDELDGRIDSTIQINFARAWLQWQQVLPDGWLTEVTLSGGPEETSAVFREADEAFDRRTAGAARLEAYRAVPEDGWVGWRMGIDLEIAQQDFNYTIDELQDLTELAGEEAGEALVVTPGIYLEQTQRAGPVEGVPGVRVDLMMTDSGYQALAVDPRFALRWQAAPSTRLRGSVGQYSQFPLLRELERPAGEPTLLPERALQSSVGVDQTLGSAWRIEATAYHLWLQDVIVGREDRFMFQLGPPPTAPLDTDPYANDGTGRNYGLETLVRYEDPRLLAWVGTTVSRATRVKRPGLERTRFEYDQPLLLTAVGSYRLPRAWMVGTRLRYGSGNPYTPIANRVFSLEDHEYLPIYDLNNSARTPAYFALDVRVDKTWTFEKWRLVGFVDLQNATNRRNVEMINWSYDWSQEIRIYGLPLLPAFWLRGEW